MRTRTRRDFLRMMSACASAAAGSGWLTGAIPCAIRDALALPAAARTGSIMDVGHVVIFMQENRSFDHYFGSLRGVRGFNDPRPLRLRSGEPVWHQPAASVRTDAYNGRGLADDVRFVMPFHLDLQATTEFMPGTDHSWSTGHLAWNDGHYDEWVNQKQDTLTMGYLKRADLRYHYALADAFTVCDAYFCSVHADTAPNRIMLFSGTLDACNTRGTTPNGPGLSERDATDAYTWTTYPERLETAGIDWRVYQGGTGLPGDQTDNYSNNSLEFFSRFQRGSGAPAALLNRGVAQHTLAQFCRDVAAGCLPQVSWIVAPQKYCEHPSASPTDGAYYIDLILGALTSNPEVWGKTALFVNYDENDGFFDHVVPPVPSLASGREGAGMVSASLADSLDDEIVDLDHYPRHRTPLIPGADRGGRQPMGLGPRVPMIVVSPWTKGGWVCSQVFDHTSVLQFLEARFGVAEPNISKWRRAVCGDLTSAFDFSVPPDRDPNPAGLRFGTSPRVASLGAPLIVPAYQRLPEGEPGTRPARAVPYGFAVNVRPEGAKLRMDFMNNGRAGAAFYVYDRLSPERSPRRYTVVAGDALFDLWETLDKQGRYELAVYGPNGWMGEFRGIADGKRVRPRVIFSADAATETVSLLLTNAGACACSLRIKDAYDRENAVVRRLKAAATFEERRRVSAHSGWYDFNVTATDPFDALWRYAGHLETGRPSTSDPGPVRSQTAL